MYVSDRTERRKTMGGFGGAGGLGSGVRRYDADDLINALEHKLQQEMQAFEEADDHVAAYSVRSQLGHVAEIKAMRQQNNARTQGLAHTSVCSMGGMLI
jgi:predicted GNAT family acetyltransferase